MFTHIFRYRLKCLLRDKTTIFWTMIFPIALAIFFNMSLANINSGEAFRVIKVAVVDDANYQQEEYFQAALKTVSEGDKPLFDLTVTSLDKARQMLEEDAIAGYILVQSPLKLVVKQSGLNQNIIKSFLDSYQQTSSSINSILRTSPTNQAELLQALGEQREYLREVSGTSAEPNNVLNYFYTLIAMACFYGGFLGMREVTDIQADISPLAARFNLAPVHKLKAFLSSISASFVIHLVEMLLLLTFLRFVLQVDFGSKTSYVLLTTLIGSIAGIFFGALICALVKKSVNMTVAILIGVTMTGSFLAGMMYQNMKYIVSQNVPLLSYLNPVNLLTDAFYSLYYYNNLDRYFLNVTILSIFAVIFCAGTYLVVRRRKYASL